MSQEEQEHLPPWLRLDLQLALPLIVVTPPSTDSLSTIAPLTPPSVSTTPPAFALPEPAVDAENPAGNTSPEEEDKENEDPNELTGLDDFEHARLIITHAVPKMLNARRMNKLLSINVNEHAAYFAYAVFHLQLFSFPFSLFIPSFLFPPSLRFPILFPRLITPLQAKLRTKHLSIYTDHGTILSLSEGAPIDQIRSFAALTGITWRRHAASITSSATPSTSTSTSSPSSSSPLRHLKPAADVQHVRTLKLIIRKGSNPPVLKAMLVQWEGLLAAIEEMKGRCLLAAIRGHAEGDAADLAEGMAKMKIGAKDKKKKEKEKNDGQGMEGGERMDTNGDNGDDEAKGDGETEGEVEPGKLQILQVRAEAVAEAALEEWPAPLPDDFY